MNAERLLMILEQPHTSEKATILADKKQFTFKVAKDATKNEIKLAVEEIFNVKVKNVAVINVKGKVKRFRQKAGKRNDWKKAFVSLHENFDINFEIEE